MCYVPLSFYPIDFKNTAMCLLGPLNVLSFGKQIYIFLKIQKFSRDFWCLIFEVRILKSKIPIQNGYHKYT